MSQEFKTLKEVADYLRGEGWKVAQSRVYKHVNEGRLRPCSWLAWLAEDKIDIFDMMVVRQRETLYVRNNNQ